ncbi:beta-1,4-mannosyl-glycoprotein 4-beta-N-acetylglucosaminyltransferase isoform X1 [Lingula anatina]|uniref:Beta-1,4-mannosyl-glycoprotein 4-beta-N-acetylglucosaminyltransferase isoform X1 n=3 Tax=Lingula anatina TaxID=7574 RepID=A0A1S3KAI8_LINAN|nr:beta-1,4-mannosyl-glycoprotein 4-beta-N-acetylglucosaminyltransferase isoform X1 [Lingula anatina]|eukprot:XP_013419653.1 beta-1,4-mannosyl-glycoprotein 4-beta-N-acetylglucosaminyltransferase isoform X1 [Lingula anatina]
MVLYNIRRMSEMAEAMSHPSKIFNSKQCIKGVIIAVVLMQLCGMSYYLVFTLGKQRQKNASHVQDSNGDPHVYNVKVLEEVLHPGGDSNFKIEGKKVAKVIGNLSKKQQDFFPKIKSNISVYTTQSQRVKFSETLQKQKSFKKFNKYISQKVILGEDKKSYFHIVGTKRCFKEGTKSFTNQGLCTCLPNWYGPQCSIPACVHFADYPPRTLHVRKNPRRIIHAFPFNHEFEALTTLLHEVGDVVDQFIIVESNYSAYGDKKQLRLLKALNSGFGAEYHSKILYIFLDHFPEGGRKDGWIADAYIRAYCGKKGLKHIGDLRPDDIMIITDADELPSRDLMLFLKWHNGFPEPFGIKFRWSVYGYYWKMPEISRIMVGCSMFIFKYVFQYDTSALRKAVEGTYLLDKPSLRWLADNVTTEPWFFGSHNHLGGWHCSWCFKPKGIATKLTSAQNGDYPRWGDFPEKQNLTYIANLIKTGTWFDGNTLGEGGVVYETPKTDPFFAPSYLLKNPDKFKYLLKNPYRKLQNRYNQD